MSRRNPYSAANLLLLLIVAVGPLQAQTVFACLMMDAVVRGECCCDDHIDRERAVDSDLDSNIDRGCADCDAPVASGTSSCCELSVEVSVDRDAREDNPLVKPAEVYSDLDPPQALLCSFEAFTTPKACFGLRDSVPTSTLRQSGSDTWLLTQRLRI